MIDLRVLAFDPVDARNIAQAILDESTLLINDLNDVARQDTLRYSQQELDNALARLKEARQAVTAFRNRHQMVDPSADVQGQVGVVTSLQQQLAEALVQLGLLQANAQANDPRIEQSELRIRTIREQIDSERQKFGSETATGEPCPKSSANMNRWPSTANSPSAAIPPRWPPMKPPGWRPRASRAIWPPMSNRPWPRRPSIPNAASRC
ncbi:hypothetical protein [Paracoccus homiensis]|uniref:hypothetical protein n=1 Tax=Paracoccus homiensis TaxID=364199 RepID=UPI00398D258F